MPDHASAPPVLIDAMNLAYWCGSPPSLRVPLGLMRPLLARGDHALLYFDASARYRLADEAALYARLLLHTRHCVEVPSGRTADSVMLRHARDSGGSIVSRDRYRDYRRRHRKLIDDPARLMSGGVDHDTIRIPALSLEAELPGSAEAAWLGLLPFL